MENKLEIMLFFIPIPNPYLIPKQRVKNMPGETNMINVTVKRLLDIAADRVISSICVQLQMVYLELATISDDYNCTCIDYRMCRNT